MAEPLTKTREKNLRHGVKAWEEIPTSRDVESFFATIDALRAQVARLEEKLEAVEAYEQWRDEHMAADPGKIPACLGPGCPACKLAADSLLPRILKGGN